MSEMQLTTEERLEKLKRSTKLKKSPQNENKYFLPVPDAVIFQNFKQTKIYTVPVSLVNVDNVSRINSF